MGESLDDKGGQQVLLVSIGEQLFGIPITQIQDVLGGHILTKVPTAPSAISGIMNLRGRLVMAVNLRKRLKSNSEQANAEQMSIVIESQGELFSLLVDGVAGVINLKSECIEDPPVTLNPVWKEVCTSVYQLPEKVVVLLDTLKVIQSEAVTAN